MKTITVTEFNLSARDHTGPVHYIRVLHGGQHPFTAAIKGRELTDSRGHRRMFKTAAAAEAAILKHVGKASGQGLIS